MLDIQFINQFEDLKFLIVLGVVITIALEAIFYINKNNDFKRMRIDEYIFQFVLKTLNTILITSGTIFISGFNGSDRYFKFMFIFLIVYIIWRYGKCIVVFCKKTITIVKEIITLVKDRKKKQRDNI